MREDRPPREGLRMLLKAAGAALLIVVLAAAATATAGLLELDRVAQKIAQQPEIKDETTGEAVQVDEAPPGQPQTILIIGSDRRWSDVKKNNPLLTHSNPARSDTIMLLRLDPNRDVIAALSVPRDLQVTIPGHGVDKINAAYSVGGASLTLKTLREVLGIKINHVVNVNFRGFRQAVNAVGCVYVDIDRRYYHSNLGLPVGQRYAEIDIDPGYQKLCGQTALDYVRFRHADSDIVRAARQQDFLRAAKDQLSTSALLGEREHLIDIFGKSTQSDHSLRTPGGLLKLVKLAIYSAGNPVREIEFPHVFAGDPETGQYVTASPEAIAQVVDEFLHARPKRETDRRQESSQTQLTRKAKKTKAPTVALQNVTATAKALARQVKGRVPFDVYFPRRLSPQAQFTTVQPNPRVYGIRDRGGKLHKAYRLVVVENEIEGQYSGVQAMSWTSPPMLAHPTSARIVNGRRLLLFRDGTKLRYVAWRHKDAVYWVSNTLSLSLGNAQMLGIAASLTRLGASSS